MNSIIFPLFKQRRILLTLACASFLIFSLAPNKAFSKTQTEETALEKLSKLLSPIKDIEGQFVQFMVDARGTRVQEVRGDFKAKRPDYFLWRTTQPLEQTIYVDGDEVTVYDPDLEQASVQFVGDQLKATPAVLFSGNAQDIAALFVVEHKAVDANVDQFLLYPKQSDSLFELFRVRFNAGRLSDMRISDSLGQDTTVSFIQTQVNNGIDNAAFKPDFPSSVDVIRASEP